MAFRVDKRAFANAFRQSPGFAALTHDLERRSVSTAQQLASQRVRRRTGEYEGGFEAKFTPSTAISSLGRLRLSNRAKHAPIIEDGSRPHRIRVRRAKVLMNTETGEVFGTQVNHPGTRPQHIIRDALQRIAGGGR